MRNDPTRHRADRGNPSLRVDPYVLEDVTFTLEEYRREQAMAQHASAARSGRTARPVRAGSKAA